MLKEWVEWLSVSGKRKNIVVLYCREVRRDGLPEEVDTV